MHSFLAAGRRLVYRIVMLSTNIECLGRVPHRYFEYRFLPRIEHQGEVRPRPFEEECGTRTCAILSMINAVVEKQKNSSSANGCLKHPKVEIEMLEK